MAVKLVLTGLLILGSAAFQVFADQKCYTTVVCNRGNDGTTEWKLLRAINASITEALREDVISLKEMNFNLSQTVEFMNSTIAMEKIQSLAELTTSLQTRIDNLDSAHSTQDGQISNLQGRMNTAEGNQRSLLSRMSTVETEQGKQNNDISSLTTRINVTESKTSGISAKVEELHYGQLRLVGPVAFQGRVEIYMNGEWGTVCDDHWGQEDSDVVCRQLQLGDRAISWNGQDTAQYGQGSGRILMDDVHCVGTETKITECAFKSNADKNCDHVEDVGVKCR